MNKQYLEFIKENPMANDKIIEEKFSNENDFDCANNGFSNLHHSITDKGIKFLEDNK